MADYRIDLVKEISLQIEIQFRPANSVANIQLLPGETLCTEGGAMLAMSPHLNLETTTYKKGKGSLIKAVKRIFAGESFFLNHYSATGEAELWLAPSHSGDIEKIPLSGQTLIVQSGSFLAATSGVQVDVGWQGFKSFFSGESLFWLAIKGQGDLLLSSFGCIYCVEVDGEYIVDTGHIVAFDESLNFTISKAGTSWLHSFLGGEGLICRFKGKGRVWCQSHNPGSLGLALHSHLKPRRA